MILENRASEVGDIIYIQADVPLIGLVALASFIDVTSGEYSDRYFVKKFRYSNDGITWTQFVPLTIPNIAGVQINPNSTFYAEYTYERVGSDITGDLEFDSVTLSGTFITPTTGPAYTASIFPTFFPQNNICSIAWSVSVLEKLYKKGIVPNYIERNVSGDGADDKDYIDFWRGITHYFALYVCLAREFQFYYNNHSLLLEYVKERGLFVCEDTSYVDLFYLMEFYYDEIRQRGTRQVFIPKALDTTVSNSKQVDGEYLRLICYDVFDEFIRNLNKNEHIGWNLGNSSPLYKGLEDRLNVNKYYVDYVEDINDLSELSISTASLPYISLDEQSNSDSCSCSHSHSSSGSGSSSDNSFKEAIIISAPPINVSVGLGKEGSTIITNEVLGTVIIDLSAYSNKDFKITGPLSYGILCNITWQGSLLATLNLMSSTINSGGSGFTSTNDATTITLSCPIGTGSTMNGLGVVIDVTSTFTATSFTEVISGGVDEVTSSSKRIIVNPNIDYEITFFVKACSTKDQTITFGVDCWDKNDNPITLTSNLTLANSSEFLTQAQLNKSGRYYFVRGIIYRKNTYQNYDPTLTYDYNSIVTYGGLIFRAKRAVPVDGTSIDDLGNSLCTPGSSYVFDPRLWDFWQIITSSELIASQKTNLGLGQNLIFKDDVVQIDPYIMYDNVNGSVNPLHIYDIRVQPLSTPYSKGFIQKTNLLEVWSINNNQNQSELNIEKITNKYLIPYNTVLKSNFLPSELN